MPGFILFRKHGGYFVSSRARVQARIFSVSWDRSLLSCFAPSESSSKSRGPDRITSHDAIITYISQNGPTRLEEKRIVF